MLCVSLSSLSYVLCFAVLCMFLDITTYIVTKLHILSISVPNVWCVEPKKWWEKKAEHDDDDDNGNGESGRYLMPKMYVKYIIEQSV